jgi:hypothetical protein
MEAGDGITLTMEAKAPPARTHLINIIPIFTISRLGPLGGGDRDGGQSALHPARQIRFSDPGPNLIGWDGIGLVSSCLVWSPSLSLQRRRGVSQARARSPCSAATATSTTTWSWTGVSEAGGGSGAQVAGAAIHPKQRSQVCKMFACAHVPAPLPRDSIEGTSWGYGRGPSPLPPPEASGERRWYNIYYICIHCNSETAGGWKGNILSCLAHESQSCLSHGSQPPASQPSHSNLAPAAASGGWLAGGQREHEEQAESVTSLLRSRGRWARAVFATGTVRRASVAERPRTERESIRRSRGRGTRRLVPAGGRRTTTCTTLKLRVAMCRPLVWEKICSKWVYGPEPYLRTSEAIAKNMRTRAMIVEALAQTMSAFQEYKRADTSTNGAIDVAHCLFAIHEGRNYLRKPKHLGGEPH